MQQKKYKMSLEHIVGPESENRRREDRDFLKGTEANVRESPWPKLGQFEQQSQQSTGWQPTDYNKCKWAQHTHISK